jgi:hypothetical protein
MAGAHFRRTYPLLQDVPGKMADRYIAPYLTHQMKKRNRGFGLLLQIWHFNLCKVYLSLRHSTNTLGR